MKVSTERLKKIASWRETYGDDANVMIPALEAKQIVAELLAVREATPVVSGENCWSCGKFFTYEQRSECDGYCPHCDSPVDLDDDDENPEEWSETISIAISAIEDLLETADKHAGCWADVPAKLRALTAPPAPEVPDEKTFEQIAQETDDGIGGYSIRDCVVAAHWWNACRAAMLQPVSQGYTFDGLNIRAVAALRSACSDQWLNSKVFADKVHWQNMHSIANEIMEALAAAPTPTK